MYRGTTGKKQKKRIYCALWLPQKGVPHHSEFKDICLYLIRNVWNDSTTWSYVSRREKGGDAFKFLNSKTKLRVKNTVCDGPYFPKMATLIYSQPHMLCLQMDKEIPLLTEGSILTTTPHFSLSLWLPQPTEHDRGRSRDCGGYVSWATWLPASSPLGHRLFKPESPFKKFGYLEITMLKSFLGTELPKCPSCLIPLSLSVKHWMMGPQIMAVPLRHPAREKPATPTVFCQHSQPTETEKENIWLVG